MKFRSKGFCRSSLKLGGYGGTNSNKVKPEEKEKGGTAEIKWELRPGGMLVQKREECSDKMADAMIAIRVSTVTRFHDVSVQPTSTFGDLKMVLSMVTGLQPKEQRLLFKGKEKDDSEYLHMVGVKDNDKVLLLEDPAIKEMKLSQLLGTTCRSISYDTDFSPNTFLH